MKKISICKYRVQYNALNQTRRGFTLMELLVSIVILALILAISIPNIHNTINNGYKKVYELNLTELKEVANGYIIKENTIIQEGETKIINISDMVSSEIIKPVIDPQSKEPCEGYVIVRKNDGIYSFSPYLKCGDNYESDNYGETDLLAPLITILGDNPVSINVGEAYTDAGATALDNVDGDVTDDISVTGTLNPNIAGTYIITYTVEDAVGNESSATRTVNVIDNVLPIVAFGTNGNTAYAKSRSTTVAVSDAHSGVNANSLKYVWNTSTNTLDEGSFSTSFTNGNSISSPAGVTGEYYLWILAKDNAGNTTIERTDVFNMDNNSPVITSVTGSSSGVTTTNFTINRSGNGSDEHSGLATNPYIYQTSLNGSTWITRCTNNATSCNVSSLDDDTLYYYRICVADSLSNESCIASNTVRTLVEDYNVAEGVNKPRLAPGMTAIKWSGTTEQTVENPETDTTWYNYANQEWANAKTADGSYWVWIPRYAYKVTGGYHYGTGGAIDIKFLINNTNTTSDETPIIVSNDSENNYVLHPAFTFDDVELTGIWVAKFEMSGTTASLDSKPNVASLRNVSIGNMFTSTRNMETNNKYGWDLASGLNTNGEFAVDTNNLDTHMMKNIEWGVVAYLSKSSYGKNGNVIYTGANKEIYQNKSSTYITGNSNGTPSQDTTNTQCAYNNITDRGSGTGSCGGGASTTGNIYGIYDISGGAYENVMGNYNNIASFAGITPANIHNKYIDRYTTYSNVKYGDAVYETTRSSGGPTAWYSDYAYMPDDNLNSWFKRGGMYNDDTDAGAFYFHETAGSAYPSESWRAVVLVGSDL